MLILTTKRPTCFPQVGLGDVQLALDTAGGQTAGQVLFDGHKQDDNGNNGEDGACEQVLPLDDVVAVEDVDTHRHGLDGIGGDQAQCHGVFIPCVDEDQTQQGVGQCHGLHDLINMMRTCLF